MPSVPPSEEPEELHYHSMQAEPSVASSDRLHPPLKTAVLSESTDSMIRDTPILIERNVSPDSIPALDNQPEATVCEKASSAGAELGKRSVHDLIHSMQPALWCRSRWDSMKGSDSARQCDRCRLWVLKAEGLSAMELQKLLDENQSVLDLSAKEQSPHRSEKVRMFRRSDGKYTFGDCYARRCQSRFAVDGLFLFPFFVTGMTYLMAPGYIVPFLNHPIGRLLFFAASAWHVLGCWLFARTTNWALRCLVVAVFTGPLILTPMLAPNQGDFIMQAVGPYR